MATVTKTKQKSKKPMGKPNCDKKMSKKELEMRSLADEVRQILKKHKVKPFNRAELYVK